MERVSLDTERDFFMASDAAKNYGIIDNIVERKS
jgi:ATP-dependent Clp protease protease subunit